MTGHSAMETIVTDAVPGIRAQVPPSGMCPAMTPCDNIFRDGVETPSAAICPGSVQMP